MYYHVGIVINHGWTVCAPTNICGSRDVFGNMQVSPQSRLCCPQRTPFILIATPTSSQTF